ncbi:MAG: NifU family protein [Deltaproteobacteria bacterium]|nr:NifU family protein [Deltaproteobacteria bacterium]
MQTAAQNDISVNLEFTPNPDTLKYATNMTLLPSGAANFVSLEAAKGKSLLAEELFQNSKISAVMIGKDFVTVTVKDQSELETLNQGIIETIRNFLLSGRQIVLPQDSATSGGMAKTEIEKKIIEILDAEIRPAVAMDGGDISFEKYEDGFVYLRMQGSCAGCPSSMMTLKMGVETRLKDAIPEIQEVIPV